MAATLDDLRLFLDHVAEPGWRTCYSADIGIWSGEYSVTMKRKYMSEIGNKKKEETSRTFRENLELLEVIRIMIACPTWSRGDFVFNNKQDFVPELNDLMMQLFSLLGSSSSLCTFHIMFYGFYHTHLPRLLGELRFLETLILDARPMALPEHAESIAAFFEQNGHSTLKSCTLDLNSCNFESGSCSAVKTILRPLINGAALKELTIRITPRQQTDSGVENPVCKKLACPNCHQAMADMVRQNTSLVKFELCSSYSRDNVTALFGSALEANQSLQEFGFPCSIAGLIELSRCLQANTSLSTLKLFPPSDCYGEEFMRELGKLLKHNNTLKDVRVAKQRDGNSWPAWESENLTAAKYVERKTWDKMESIMKNELQCNTTLNSLVVGNWTLLRVANQWKLSYEGPCLTTLTTEGLNYLLTPFMDVLHLA